MCQNELSPNKILAKFWQVTCSVHWILFIFYLSMRKLWHAVCKSLCILIWICLYETESKNGQWIITRQDLIKPHLSALHQVVWFMAAILCSWVLLCKEHDISANNGPLKAKWPSNHQSKFFVPKIFSRKSYRYQFIAKNFKSIITFLMGCISG